VFVGVTVAVGVLLGVGVAVGESVGVFVAVGELVGVLVVVGVGDIGVVPDGGVMVPVTGSGVKVRVGVQVGMPGAIMGAEQSIIAAMAGPLSGIAMGRTAGEQRFVPESKTWMSAICPVLFGRVSRTSTNHGRSGDGGR
jgi:hypothetical protein